MRVFLYLRIWILRSLAGTQTVPGRCRWHRSPAVARPPSSGLSAPGRALLFLSPPPLDGSCQHLPWKGTGAPRYAPTGTDKTAPALAVEGHGRPAICAHWDRQERRQLLPWKGTGAPRCAPTGTDKNGASTCRGRARAPRDMRPLGPTKTAPALAIEGHGRLAIRAHWDRQKRRQLLLSKGTDAPRYAPTGTDKNGASFCYRRARTDAPRYAPTGTDKNLQTLNNRKLCLKTIDTHRFADFERGNEIAR